MVTIKQKIILACALCLGFSLYAQDRRNSDIDGVPDKQTLRKPTARVDEAIGVMNKGQLCNLTMNYGQITDTRLEDPGNRPTDEFYNFRYPKVKPYGSMVDDFALCFAVAKNSKNGDNGNFIDGYTANGNEDWIAKDGSLGKTHYDGSGEDPMLTYVDGTTPYLAHSDLPQTWPMDANGDRFWPGYFRRNPSTGETFTGEFASDRDVYSVFTDANNVQGNSLGLEIEQMAYCYGRVYAEDFQFYEFFVHNTSADTIKDAWIGLYQDPDCGDYGEEILIVPAGYSFSDPYPVVMQRDFTGDIGGATFANSVGRYEDMDFGIVILETPKNVGVTDFHYFTDAGPTFDDELWPIISSKKDDPDIAMSVATYFHGDNPKLDEVALIQQPQDWVYMVASGPFDLAPGEVVKYSIGVVVGDTDADFINNVEMAVQMFEKGFVGPSAPPGPEVAAVAGDEKITLYWDNSSESKADPLTGEIDFEGYKIYRSQDGGATWGTPVTNAHGDVIGYVPIAQFDIDNTIEGYDPISPSNYLGANTGLQYIFVDENVINGIEYSYTITAYDRGDKEANIPSFETAKGTGAAEKHFVTCTPRPDPLAYVSAYPMQLNQISGKGRGKVTIRIVDSEKYGAYKAENGNASDPVFKIDFSGFPAASFSVTDSTNDGAVLGSSLPLNTEIFPILNQAGIQVAIETISRIGGIQSITDGEGVNVMGSGKADASESWYVQASEIPPASLEARSNSYEIRFTAQGSVAYTKGRDPVAYMTVPFEVWRVLPDTAQVICEFEDKNNNRTFDASEFLFIGNVAYPTVTPNTGDSIKVNFPSDFPLQVNFVPVPVDSAHPLGGSMPVAGQKAILYTNSGFSDGSGFPGTSQSGRGDQFIFTIQEDAVDQSREAGLLNDIRVVPNPYVAVSLFDPRQNVHSLKFMYLPAECKITIYSLAGVKVTELDHNDGAGIENWNLTNEFGQDISFGVYVYVVETTSGDTHVGKFAIIK
ncbi:MAG: hypothetical protein ACOY90_03390 [Candidatus Zhuqueibacterota bacterium]